jgi:hypothetical protein
MWDYLAVSVRTKSRTQSGWNVVDPVGMKGVPWPEALARLGAEGWELVAAVPDLEKSYTNLEHAHFVFKRPA